MPVWIKEKLFQKDLLRTELEQIAPAVDWRSRLLFAEHHISHAASAYYPSPFDEAVVLTLDGVGEWCTTSAGVGRGNQLSLERELHFPHSLGLLYSAVTYYTGFKVNSGEYKVMGLAPYGEPRYAAAILDHIMDLKSDGSFRLDQSYFDYCTGLTMTSAKFADLFGEPVRAAEDRLTQFHMDMAASVQKVTEEVMLRLTRSLQAESGASNLCLAGGVALNCVANGKVLRDGKFKNIWIQPAAGDAGGALGAALSAYHGFLDRPRRPCRQAADGMRGAYLGPAFRQEEINRRLAEVGARFDTVDQTTMLERTAQDLADGCAVGWFQGRMEFGPRALGARSILGDARSPSMQKTLNLRVKYREIVPPIRAVGFERTCQRLVRDRPSFALHADGGRRCGGPAPQHDQRGAGTVRHRQAQCHSLRDPRCHPCRLLRAHPDCASRHQPDLSRPDRAVPRLSPAVPCSSIPPSTCAASRLCARPRTPSAASWAPTSNAW